MSILSALKTQTNSIDDLAALPQAMIMQMAQKGQIREDMLAPILGRKAEMAEAVARTRALQGAGQQPTVMEQIMARNAVEETPAPEAREMGVAQLPVRGDMYQGMAGGGIVAFADGGDIDDDEDEDYQNAIIDRLMMKPRNRYDVEESSFGISSKENPFMPRGNFGAIAVKTAEKYGLDPEYVTKIMAKETGGLKDPARAVSPAGAQGIMQLMPGTAKEMGVKDSFDPYQNIEGGVKYLAQLNKKYDDPRIAAIAYNWGPGNTDKWLKAGADFNKLPAETRKYVASLAEGGEVRGYYKGDMVSAKDSLAPNEEIVDVYPSSKSLATSPMTPDDLIEEMMKEREAIKSRANEDKNLALLAAGLGMMGSTSPYAFANIGQGAMKGVEQYATSQKGRAAELASLNKNLSGVLRAKGIEELRREEAANLAEYRRDKLAGQTEKTESQAISKIEGIVNRNPIVLDYKKRMELTDPTDPKYKYYADEIEKIYESAYINAGIKVPRVTATVGTPPEAPKKPGFWERLFPSSKPSSGSKIKFNEKGQPNQ